MPTPLKTGDKVHHIKQREGITRLGHPERAIVGEVIDTGYVVNDGTPCATIHWTDGSINTYDQTALSIIEER